MKVDNSKYIITGMSKIRKLYCFDKKNMQEMIAFLNNHDNYIDHIMFNPLMPIHHLLPLKLKFLPESYVLKDNQEIKGLITIAPVKSPATKMEILKLFFEENCYSDAAELIQYAVSKYKALGVTSFITKINDYLPELLRVFITKCGFTQISYEKLWKIDLSRDLSFNKKNFRLFRNSDAQTVASLYNESLLPHFRVLLSKEASEFKEIFCKGLSYFNEYKYILEEKNSVNAYISVQTADNENFILDITQSSWVELDLDNIINFACYQISKRKKKFALYIKTKRYSQLGEKYEQEFLNRKYECVQNQIVLTNTSARIVKDTCKTGKYTILSQFYGANLT